MCLNHNQLAFFALVKAGLWEQNVRLSHFNDLDFGEVLRLAEEQSVVGLVAAGLEHVEDIKVPKEDALQFIGETLQLEQRNQSMNEFVARLIERLREVDIFALLVKGQGIAQCYERPLWRTCGDVDLLLSVENYEKAKKELIPLATNIKREYTHFKHQALTIGDWEVELHGTLHTRLSKRVDRVVDLVQDDIFNGGSVRSWQNGNTRVYLPSPDNDVIFVFTHILQHFFFEGVGLRQICDWCRLLWTNRESLDHKLLESRIRKMGLMSEWRSFAALAVEYLGISKEAMPLYSDNTKWRRKAERVCYDVIKVGNFGHNRGQTIGLKQPYLIRKFLSFWTHLGFALRHFPIFPKDSVVFFGGVLRSGLSAVVRGE